MLFAETLCHVMFGLGLEAVTLHSRVSLLPSTTVLSRGYVVCNEGESERRQRLLVSYVKCLYDINAKTECTDWNITEIVCVAGAWKPFCKKERGVFLPHALYSFLRPLLPGAYILGFQFDVPIIGRHEGLTYQKCKDNPMSFKKSRTAKVPLLLSWIDSVLQRYRIKEF